MKAIYERPLSRADLIALLGHFAGSPYRDRLEQIAAHDDAQREIISAQAREIARLAAPSQAYLDDEEERGYAVPSPLWGTPAPAPDAASTATPSEEDECPCCLTHSCPGFRRYVASVLAERAHCGTGATRALLASEPAKGAKRCAGECPDCHGAGLYGVTDENGDQDTVICRHHAPPAGAAVREAAERLETWTDPATGDQYAHGRCVGAPASAGIGEAAERLHPYADWHEDDGTVLWYAVPVEEPPYCGEPLFSDWPKEWNAPYDTVTGAFIDGPYTGKVLMWQRLPELPLLAARRDGQKGEA